MIKLKTLLTTWQKNKTDKEAANQILENAKKIVLKDEINSIDEKFWSEFLNITHKTDFLLALENSEKRNEWAELVFIIIQNINFSLLDLMKQRVKEHPSKILFHDTSKTPNLKWSYKQVFSHIREIAAVFHKKTKEPRVAIFSQNRLYGAMTDLACLMFDIFNTPLNVHFSEEILIHIFNELDISIVVCDTESRLKILKKIQKKVNTPYYIYVLIEKNADKEAKYLFRECKKLDLNEIDTILSKRTTKKINTVATTMFTSGSTGLPKGVSFSYYNLVSKRFARGAALPKLGNDEILLCYLPLFHTFGRYLEMLASIYWHGTYVFVGNTSKETLLDLFPKINPTIFISIPLRWKNLYEKCIEKTENINSEEVRSKVIKTVIGSKLKWGLSAAGYLSPKVFKFFQENKTGLCSGFGMTEATGGITMTIPDNYQDNSVGLPLPGVYTRLKETGELELSGHYIAKYLPDAQPNEIIPFPKNNETDYWLPTGDIFTIDKSGHHEIIDRVKDIYKNNKGQTVAPRVIEQKFNRVPGIKNVFVVGDGRPYNVLLIAPNYEDSLLQSIKENNQEEYFHQIIMTANKDIAPYERIVNFAILERDFDENKEELTPKGSFNRKKIQTNFKQIINKLYLDPKIKFNINEITISIPKWFFRELGILDNDILLKENKLFNRQTKQSLTIKQITAHTVLIGNLIYTIKDKNIDLGLIARQPKLWLGNYELTQFCPLKESLDIPLKEISDFVRVHDENKILEDKKIKFKKIPNSQLNETNRLITKALFSTEEETIQAVKSLEILLQKVDKRVSKLIRKRLESLAYSEYKSVRVIAYRILLLDNINSDYQESFPTFLESGKSFLNEESINRIAKSNLGKKQLQLLRQRLYTYRINLDWNISETQFLQFENILKLLYNFSKNNYEFIPAVRSELASWSILKETKSLSKIAQLYKSKLIREFDKHLTDQKINFSYETWTELIVFGANVTKKEQERILRIFHSTFFFQKSVIFIFNEPKFNFEKIKKKGIWVDNILSLKDFLHYRVSINLTNGKHYDIHLVLSRTLTNEHQSKTQNLTDSIAGHPFEIRIIPALGCNNSELGVLSTQFVGGLSVWDKIKQYSYIHKAITEEQIKRNWRKLFITAFSVFYKTWEISGKNIVPGIISPTNVVVPELDFKDKAMLISLTGWKKYENTLSIIKPIIKEFYHKTIALYPLSKKYIKIEWIFDAYVETFKKEESEKYLNNLKSDLEKNSVIYFEKYNLLHTFENYLKEKKHKFYFPLVFYNAIDKFNEWILMNPSASPWAKKQTISELIELYKLQNYPEIVRYKLYRDTYFKNIDTEIQNKFDLLLKNIEKEINASPLKFTELSDLQSIIKNKEDKKVFLKMVFPNIKGKQKFQIQKIDSKQRKDVVVKSELKDKKDKTYICREPIDPSEVGQLYQLFYKEYYPKDISERDKHLILTDSYERIIGGLVYKELEDNIVLLDGMVINSTLQGRGLGSIMLEDFFTRMSSKGIKVIKAHFLFGNYYLKHYFKVDKKWGALVRFL